MGSDKSLLSPLPDGFKPPHLLSGMDEASPVLVGLSGGADSTALLHILCRYSELTGAKISAAHVNHGIRGEEADRDENFCRELASNLGVSFYSIKVNVPEIAKNTGESIETAARRIRYEYFDSLMKENGIKQLATAHNADDNLETVIFNIARGTGLGGVCGIPSYRSTEYGCVVRPILNMEKSEIIEYCRANSLSFVTDSTNTDIDYTRNKIRAQIIPVMRQINPAAVRNAARMSETLREDSFCIDKSVDQFIDEYCVNCSVAADKILEFPPALVNRALIRLYDNLSAAKTLEQVHIVALRNLAKKAEPHSSVSLPNDIEGIIENGRLCLRKKIIKPEGDSVYDILLCDDKTFISQTNCEIFIDTSHKCENIYKNSILMSIDSAKIKGDVYARQRQSGDRILMGGMHKSVKKLMCDKKIPLEIRSRIPIIYDSDGILAIPFIGIRDNAKSNTKQLTDTITNIHFYLL